MTKTNALRLLAVVLPAALSGAACAPLLDPATPGYGSATIGSAPAVRGDLGSLTYRSVDLIVAGAPEVTSETPLIVASVSDAQNVDASSPLGNIVSDLIKTRLVQDGRSVSEMRLRAGVHLNPGQGDFVLSRNRRDLGYAPNAAAVLTGTYAVSWDRVYVSLKLVSSVDAHILSAADFVVPRGDDVNGLLESQHGRRG
nr:FlgO family outer membrane protein [uncultured Rhodopila sp.]